MKKIKWLFVGLLFLLASCRSSYILSSWKKECIEEKKYNKVLILGPAHNSDHGLQENIEKRVAAELVVLVYTVITSLNEYADTFNGLTQKEILVKLKNSGIDAVVTIALLNKKMEKQYVPGYDRLPGDGYFKNIFWNYYEIDNNLVPGPGYYFDHSEYILECNFYEMKSETLVYSVTTQSLNPNTTESLAHEYGKVIVKNMLKKNIVKKQAAPRKKGF
jgi:hypothetical protein